ncbi:MAG: anti-sigma factor family protein, partial [Planctomycetota bacterium]
MMTEGSHQQPQELLDAYADGLLTGEQHETVEQALLARPELQRQLHHQQAINGALQRRLTPPPARELQALLEDAEKASADGPGPARSSWRLMTRRLAVAAALAAGAFGAWQIWSFLQPRPPGYPPMPWRSLAAIYQDEITSGF